MIVFNSFIISFAYGTYKYFVIFIAKYSFFGNILNGFVFLILNSIRSLLVYGETMNFYLLINLVFYEFEMRILVLRVWIDYWEFI